MEKIMPSQNTCHAKNRATTKPVPYFFCGNGVDMAGEAAQNFPHFETLREDFRLDPTDKETLIQLGQRVKAYRERAGLSQAKLGELAGVPQSGVSQLESGVRSMLCIPFHRLAKALNVSESALIDGEG
jgi:ribosome-binding protein aMBF1 (putative translation factor)